MQENIKDPYHPGLLHTWFVTFGLWRADNRSELKMDRHFRHAAMISTRGQGGKGSVTSGVSSFKEQMSLNDDRFLDIVPEPWWNGPTADDAVPQRHHPAAGQFTVDPPHPAVGHDAFDFVRTHFGFADDSPEMTRRRLRQANLFGPAGFVSADDGEVIEFSQAGFAQKPWHRSVAGRQDRREHGAHGHRDADTRHVSILEKVMAPSAARFQGRGCGPAEPDPRCPDEDGIA